MAAPIRMRSRFTGRGFTLARGFCAGAGPNVNMTLTGIKLGDKIVAVFELTGDTSTSGDTIAADRTSVAVIVSANTIKLTNQTSAGRQLDVLYWSR